MTTQWRQLDNDGQDWLVNKWCCNIPLEIKDVKIPLGFTLRIDEALRPGATCFSDFDSRHISALWEIIFQQFLFLGEVICRRVESTLKKIGRSRDDILEVYIEPVLDNKKYFQDMTTNYCKTAATAYTVWIFIKDLNIGSAYESFFDVDAMYDEIVSKAIQFTRQVSGDNSKISKALEKLLDEEDEDENEAEEESAKKKKQQDRDRKILLKDLSKHERWKLLSNREMLGHIFDMMMHHEEWQTKNINEITFNRLNMLKNPTSANTLFNPFVAFYARDPECVATQTVFNMHKVFERDPVKNTYTVRFPLPTWTIRIPIAALTVKNFIGKRLPLYMLNSTFSITKVLPILIAEIEQKVEESEKVQTITSKKIVSKNRSTWDSQYKRYVNTVKYVVQGINEIETRNMPVPDLTSDEESNEEDFRVQAVQMSLQGRLQTSNHIEAIIDDVMRERQQQNAEEQRQKHTEVTSALQVLRERASAFGIGSLIDRVIKEQNGKIHKLIESQIVGCTNIWPEGTAAKDSTDDSYRFISAYDMLSVEYACGITAIRQISKRIAAESMSCGSSIKNPIECQRKLLIILKKHMLNEYATKCMSLDAYGISPYQKAVLRWMFEKKPFEKKIVHTKFDKSLSLFSSQECRKYQQINNILQMAGLHAVFSAALKISADCFKADREMCLGMIVFSKKGGTGKSNIADEVKFASIPGTARYEAYRTDKADASSVGNMDGCKTIWPELQQSVINDNDPKNQGASLLKEKITSGGLTSGTRLKPDGKGGFEQEFISSYNRCSIVANTNMNAFKLSNAVKSRFYIVPIDGMSNYRSIIEAKAAEYLSPDQDDKKREFREENMFMDFMIFHIEQLIKVGVLEKPTIDIGWIFMIVLTRILKSKGFPIDNVRPIQFIVSLARQNTIRNAIEKLWLQRKAKFNGKDITMEQFLYLDRKLFMSVEDIITAIGEVPDRLVNHRTDIVRKCVHHMFMEVPQGHKFKRIRETKRVPNGSEIIEEFTDVCDYNWIRFPLYSGPKDFYKKIADLSKSLGEEVSPESVEDVIVSWADCKIDAPNYSWKGDPKGTQKIRVVTKEVEEAMLNEVLPITGQKKQRSLVDKSGKSIFFLYHHFKDHTFKSSFEELKSSITEILSCAHQHDVKVAFNNNKDFPFVREILGGEEQL
jgi:hypothetical protein